ncbi:MAG TPA: SDR family NAD(P)-dependent oxidoreductase [Candidatus Onthousia faecigallinarum]|nr:SDR family NAD(P)-dependent oxidoreductase [Candidatus Onthousia faecigallinarum]
MKIFITGAYSGLGYAIAKEAAKRGHIVYAGVHKKEQLSFLEQKGMEDGVFLFPVLFRLGEEKDYRILEENSFDLIFLQAGIAEGGSLLEMNIKRIEENYQINLFENLKVLQKYLRRCLLTKQKGKIFLTSSLAAFLPLPYLGSYTSSKMSLYSIGRTLQKELKLQQLKVRLCLFVPGAYQTGFNEYMILNKEKDLYFKEEEGKKITQKQEQMFSLIEEKDYLLLAQRVVRAMEKEKIPNDLSYPFWQKIGIKIYRLISALIEL